MGWKITALGLFLPSCRYLIHKKSFNLFWFVLPRLPPTKLTESGMERKTCFHTYLSELGFEITVTY
jgi:hypothetical protein